MLRDLLLDRPDEILRLVRTIAVDTVTDAAFDELCRVLEDAAYDPGTAARESEAGFFLDLDTALLQLLRQLETAHMANKRLLPTTTFCVAVDGSRQSYIAFERTARLRRQGLVRVVAIEEDIGVKSLQLPVISSEFIIDEYKSHAARLGVPPHRVVMESVNEGSASVSVATQLLDVCARHACDFLVIGSIGKGGPAIEQLGHVPREALRFTPVPILIVPPMPTDPFCFQPAQSSTTFVLAMDWPDIDGISQRCLNAALKLLRPTDVLRVVHFFKKPVVGDYEHANAFCFTDDIFRDAQIQGVLDVLPIPQGSTVGECLHEYVAQYRASVLFVGLHGAQTNRGRVGDKHENNGIEMGGASAEMLENCIGRVARAMLFSPRCTLCMCP
ncbi:hypothetical protein ATCC90586_007748 [Pythium insidiosum]|nr:hypothetical protein ATCC90586_007748 [Pythium insidiosum]